MAINDGIIQVERLESDSPRRVPTRKTIAIGAVTGVVAVALVAAIVQLVGPRAEHQPTPRSRDQITRELVERGLIPPQTLEPAPPITTPG